MTLPYVSRAAFWQKPHSNCAKDGESATRRRTRASRASVRARKIAAVGPGISAENKEIMDLLGAPTTFIRVAESGSLSAVARQSNASHSAVTRLVGQLEGHFRVRLFRRSTRRLNLTADGQNLLGYARQLIETADEMQGVLGRQRSSPTGLVRLGVPVAALSWLVPSLPELVDRYPGLAVDLVIAAGLGDLIEERLDVALIGWQRPDSTIIARAVGTFGRMTVASPAYLERHAAPAHPRDPADHACVLHERGGDSARWRFAARCPPALDEPIELPPRPPESPAWP